MKTTSGWCVCALVMLLALGPQAAADTVRYQFKTDGASGQVLTYGPDASVQLSVSQTTTKHPDGSAVAYLSFNAISGTWPEGFVQIGGGGPLPASAVIANADRIQVNVEDLTTVPGFYLSGYRCSQQMCESFTPTAAVPVQVTIKGSRSYTVHMTGTRRLHSDLVFPVGTTYDETQNGTISYSSATVEGIVADTTVPIENPDVTDVSMSLSRGVIVSVTRTQP